MEFESCSREKLVRMTLNLYINLVSILDSLRLRSTSHNVA